MQTDEQLETLRESSRTRLEAMKASIREMGSALVAFSGGVDSTFVLRVAHEMLGERVVALTALSPSVAPAEAEEARELAERIGARHVLVDSHELENPDYAKNSTQRCYFCKTELYGLCEQQRVRLGVATVLDGFNADDRKDHRPGHKAAQEHQVRSPLAEAGLTKDEIRAWSKAFDLPTWDKPQMACLASRLPYGTSVTQARLTQVGLAEADLRARGLRTFRLRYHGEVARLEVSAEEYPRFHDPVFRLQISEDLKRRGFSFVAIDLEPFRSGRMNEAALGPARSAV